MILAHSMSGMNPIPLYIFILSNLYHTLLHKAAHLLLLLVDFCFLHLVCMHRPQHIPRTMPSTRTASHSEFPGHIYIAKFLSIFPLDNFVFFLSPEEIGTAFFLAPAHVSSLL